MKANLLFVALLCTFSACTDSTEDLTPTTTTSSDLIDAELQGFVRSFEIEAIRRGYNIDVEALGIQVELADVDGDNVAGVCYYHSHQPGRIEIDAPFYNRMSDMQREYVVFHELGHCVLGRGHSESQTSNGICLSIMASGTGNCRDNYTTRTRSIYLNELFGNVR